MLLHHVALLVLSATLSSGSASGASSKAYASVSCAELTELREATDAATIRLAEWMKRHCPGSLEVTEPFCRLQSHSLLERLDELGELKAALAAKGCDSVNPGRPAPRDAVLRSKWRPLRPFLLSLPGRSVPSMTTGPGHAGRRSRPASRRAPGSGSGSARLIRTVSGEVDGEPRGRNLSSERPTRSKPARLPIQSKLQVGEASSHGWTQPATSALRKSVEPTHPRVSMWATAGTWREACQDS